VDGYRHYWTQNRRKLSLFVITWTLLDFLGSGIGGAKRDRTADLLVANEALSQLSYSPTRWEQPNTILTVNKANADNWLRGFVAGKQPLTLSSAGPQAR
jgi:hypothetical protein